jgi:hypothetical protein
MEPKTYMYGALQESIAQLNALSEQPKPQMTAAEIAEDAKKRSIDAYNEGIRLEDSGLYKDARDAFKESARFSQIAYMIW